MGGQLEIMRVLCPGCHDRFDTCSTCLGKGFVEEGTPIAPPSTSPPLTTVEVVLIGIVGISPLILLGLLMS